MRSLTLSILIACFALALAAPAAAHHRADHQPADEPPQEPCACDPVPPGPVDVVIGDNFECVGGNSGYLTHDAGVARVTIHYCKPWIGDGPATLP